MMIEGSGEYDLSITNKEVLLRYTKKDGIHHIIRSESISNITNALSELDNICEKNNLTPDEKNELERLLSPYVEEVTIINAPEYISMPIKARLSFDSESNEYIAQDLFFLMKNKKNPLRATGTSPREAMMKLYKVMREYHELLHDSKPIKNAPEMNMMKNYLNALFS